MKTLPTGSTINMAKLASSSSSNLMLMFVIFITLAFDVHSQDIACVYTLYVKTSDVQNAGTNANVTINLYDKQGNNIIIENLDWYGLMPDTDYDYFQRGNVDMFGFRTECLASSICKIELSHDNAGNNPGWHVDFLEVNVVQTKKPCNYKNFPIQQWLASDEPPYQLSVTKNTCGASKGGEKAPLTFSSYGKESLKMVVSSSP